MGVNLHHRDFLKELDFTRSELQFLLDLSRDLKRAKYAGTEVEVLGCGGRTSRSSSRRPRRAPDARSRLLRTTRAVT